jgi:hypothetical protein
MSSDVTSPPVHLTVLHSGLDRAKAEATATSALRVGIDSVALLDVSMAAVLEGRDDAWVFRHDPRLATPGERLVFALGIGNENLRQFALFDVLSKTTDGVSLVVAPGFHFRRYPEEFIDRAVTNGIVAPRRLASLVIDDMEPWMGSIAVDGTVDWGLVAASGEGGVAATAICDGILTGWQHRDFGRASRYREIFEGLSGCAAVNGCGVIDPAYLSDGEDLPDGAAIVAVPNFDPSRPYVPDNRFFRPRVTTLGRPALAAFLNEELDSQGWPAVFRYAPDAEMEALGTLAQGVVLAALDELRDSDVSNIASFCEWLRQPSERSQSGAATRALIACWESRPDLREFFPDPLGADELVLAHWAFEHGVSEGAVLSDLLISPETIQPAAGAGLGTPERKTLFRRAWNKSGRRVAPPSATSEQSLSTRNRETSMSSVSETASEPGSGALVLGHFTTLNGLGNVARAIVGDLHHADVPVSTRTWKTGSRSAVKWTAEPGPSRQFALAVLGAEEHLATRMPRDFMSAATRAGLTYWEVDSPVPGSREWSLVYTELWAPSSFVQSTFQRVTDLPVVVVPQRGSFCERLGNPLAARRLAPEVPYFLFSFDFYSVAARKNPVGLVRAYRQAFSPSDGVRLVIKTLNADGARGDYAELVHEIGGREDIEVITDDYSPAQMDELLSGAAAYVSLHRAEGFGLTMAEAMVHGIPVICTDYGGNVDFANDDTALMVAYERVPIGERGYPYPADAQWAEPSIDVAAEHMRSVLNGGYGIESKRLAAFERLQRQYGDAAIATFLREHGFSR